MALHRFAGDCQVHQMTLAGTLRGVTAAACWPQIRWPVRAPEGHGDDVIFCEGTQIKFGSAHPAAPAEIAHAGKPLGVGVGAWGSCNSCTPKDLRAPKDALHKQWVSAPPTPVLFNEPISVVAVVPSAILRDSQPVCVPLLFQFRENFLAPPIVVVSLVLSTAWAITALPFSGLGQVLFAPHSLKNFIPVTVIVFACLLSLFIDLHERASPGQFAPLDRPFRPSFRGPLLSGNPWLACLIPRSLVRAQFLCGFHVGAGL